jgi:hypothetical protein
MREKFRSHVTAIIDKAMEETPADFAFRLWLFVFFLTLLVGLGVQLLVLPVLFPQWHAGNGLLVGIDSVTYHRNAANLAMRIRESGWSVWRSRPSGPPIVDLLTLLYFAVAPTPLVMLPLNAALQATALLMLWRIIRRLLPPPEAALCVLPMMVSPTGAIWYSQILKDGFSIAGTLLFLDGWLGVYEGARSANVRQTMLSAGRCVVGALLGWSLRPYTVSLTEAAACAMLFAAVLGMAAFRGDPTARASLVPMFSTWFCIILLLSPLVRLGGPDSDLPASSAAPNASGQGSAGGPFERLQGSAGGPFERLQGSAAGLFETPPLNGWHTARWLPRLVERPFRIVSAVRDGFRLGYPDATSMIDADVGFHSVSDVVLYLPRALQIGLLSPFPGQLSGPTRRAANNMMRRVATVETVFVYFALAGLPIALWRWRHRVQIWLALTFCLAFVVIYSLTIPNVGSLYRVRYPYVMTLAAIGLAGVLSLRARPAVVVDRDSGTSETCRRHLDPAGL